MFRAYFSGFKNLTFNVKYNYIKRFIKNYFFRQSSFKTLLLIFKPPEEVGFGLAYS
jgi:hypothetical protein